MFGFISRWWARRRSSSALFEREVVVVDINDRVTASFPNGDSQSITWSGLKKVEIWTNDSGPWGADVWWVLTDSEGYCSYPQGATGEQELIPKLQELPGFDGEAFIRAMGSTSVAKFECWVRRDAF